MSFASRLRCTLTIAHAVTGAVDAWGHPEVIFPEGDRVNVPGLVQERTGVELNWYGGGMVISNALIFLLPDAQVAETDRVIHDALLCPAFHPWTGERTYEVLYVKDPAGLGHHLEVDARSVRSGIEAGP